MYPPVDPWDAPIEPTLPPATPVPGFTEPMVPAPAPAPTQPTPPTPMYGRAPVPAPPTREHTAQFPFVEPVDDRSGRGRGGLGGLGTKPISYERTSRASLRSLSDGWGFTATGALVAFCGWGVWAAAGRGKITAPYLGLIIMTVVAAGLFTVSRLLSRLIVERLLGRARLHARWSHAFVGLFLTVAGVSYVMNTAWLGELVDWIRGQWSLV